MLCDTLPCVDDDWERRIDALWASADEYDDESLVAAVGTLVDELPEGSAVGLFERAGSLDSTGRSDLAVPLYREALDRGLSGIRRRRAVIQLASSLRNVGRVAEGLELLSAEAGSDELDDAVAGFLALMLVDSGREREAVSVALRALAPHLVRYQRSLGNYARALLD